MVRRSTVACRARTRSAAASRAISRSTGASTAIASASGKTRRAVVARARDDRHEGAGRLSWPRRRAPWPAPRRVSGRRTARPARSLRARPMQRCGGVRPTGFDDRKGAGSARSASTTSGGRAVGDDDNRTLQRHVRYRLAECRIERNGAPTIANALLMARQRSGRTVSAAAGLGLSLRSRKAPATSGLTPAALSAALHGVAVGGTADQAVPEQRIGQRRQRRAVSSRPTVSCSSRSAKR